MMDLLLKRYGGGAKEVLSMPFQDGMGMVRYAAGADDEEWMRLRWMLGFQAQMGFAEFMDGLGVRRQGGDRMAEERPAGEILAGVKAIIG